VVRSRAGITKMGCLLVLLLFAAVGYVGIPVGETYFRYMQYKDAMKQELRFRGSQTDERIKRDMQIAADSLGLPEQAGNVVVARSPQSRQITIEADYEEVLRFPGYQKAIRFKPTATDSY
jgi:hypothetical protein